MEKNITYEIIDPKEENIILLENLRFDAYGISIERIDLNSFYATSLKTGKDIAFGCFINGELLAACYVTNTYDSLFIDQLFVKKSYQESGLQLGRKLLAYINLNKKIIEEYFGLNFTISRLEYNSIKSKSLYEKLGYRETNSSLGIMKKAI